MNYQEFVKRNNENKERYSRMNGFNLDLHNLEQVSWRVHCVNPMQGTDYVQLNNNSISGQTVVLTIGDMVLNIFSSSLYHVSNPSALKNYEWHKATYWFG